AEPPVLLGDDHPEEALLREKGPHLPRQVAGLLRLPFVEHRAEPLDRSVEEGLLARREPRYAEREELAPPGSPREELPVPPDRSRLEGDPLGLAAPRHQRPHPRAH